MKSERQIAVRLEDYVETNRDRLIEIVQDLVRIPSENIPPHGNERACQEYLAEFLHRLGWEVSIYELNQTEGLQSHPLYWPGRDYLNRPNLAARKKGMGNGQSLVLSGHIDTVPRGTQVWSRDPFGAQIEDNRLYGRGSNDMKSGIGISLFVAEALRELGLELQGDLIVESVVDEEFGGVNGTLAGRLMGFNGDAAIIGEPTGLKVCPAQRGGHFAHITFEAPGGILLREGQSVGVVDQVGHFLSGVRDFAETRRRSAKAHDLYAHLVDPVPVLITKLCTGPWGMHEPIGIPETCKLEVYWQALPDEEPEVVQEQFDEWLSQLVSAAPEIFPKKPVVESPLRILPGSAIPRTDPLVTAFADCATDSLGEEPEVVGIEAPCDMYVFHQFGIPALLWGPGGGNTHTSDEYVEIDSLVIAARVLLNFVCRWCAVK